MITETEESTNSKSIVETAEIIDDEGTVLINGSKIYTGQKTHLGAYYNKWLSDGNTPTPYSGTDNKAADCKLWRDQELVEFIDYYQSKPWLYSELTETQRESITNYRIELLEYPDLDGFPDVDKPERPVI